MNTVDRIIADAQLVITEEANAIQILKDNVTEEFAKAVLCIHEAAGRVIITGIGKSAIIAQKIVATMNSTGTRAIYMHAADAIHGDLGIIQEDDVVICISKSGNTPEIKVLAPLIKNFGNTLIAITSNRDSFLSQQSDFTLECFVTKEACPNNLAPTTSTTAQLVVGDAVAVCLLKLKGFTSADFAKYHPGGALGKKLYLRVEDLANANEKPEVYADTPVDEVILEITNKRLGTTAVTEAGKIIGVITDGDLRRMLKQHKSIEGLTAKDIMSKAPLTINAKSMAVSAIDLIEKHSISQLLVEDENVYKGVIHIHDLMKEGIL